MISPRYTIGILEDDILYRDELVAIIATTDSASFKLETVFVAGTLAEASLHFSATRPDLMLIDMQLPDGSGLDLMREVKAAGKIGLMLTMLGDRSSVLSALQGGAQGYLLKDMPADQLRAAICDALAGQSPISARAATYLLNLVRPQSATDSTLDRLTDRELTILNMIARGLTYAEVAQAASISVHTVGDHIKSIYRKLDVNSKSEAIHEARQLGWLSRFD